MLVDIVKLIEDERSRQDVKHGGKVMDSKRTAGDWAHYVHKQALALHDVQTADQFKKQATKIAALGVAMLELVCRDSPAGHTYETKSIVVDKVGRFSNGVTDPSGTMDEGAHIAGLYLDNARQALKDLEDES